MTPMNRSVLEVTEYEHLKRDQRMHALHQRTLVLVVLIYTGAALGLAADPAYGAVLLMVPLVCAVLGWKYLQLDDKISEINRYLAIYPECRWNQNEPSKTFEYKMIGLVAHLIVFMLTGMGALWAYWALPGTGFADIVAGLEYVLLCLLAVLFVRSSGVFARPEPEYMNL
jgi:hypothetical protein